MLQNLNIPTQMRRMTHAQTSNLGERIAEALLNPKSGVPSSDALMTSLGTDIASETRNFDLRVRLDRTNAFTQAKGKLEKERDDHVRALRRGLQTIHREPEKTVLPARREAALLLQEILDRRPKKFESMGAGENSTHLKYFFEDCDVPSAQKALEEADLMRLYTSLKEVQAAFSQVVREQEEVEAKEASLPPAENPKNLPLLHEIKQTLVRHLVLAMDNLDYLAGKGHDPYVALAERCLLIFTEAGLVVKIRQTREVKKAARAQLAN